MGEPSRHTMGDVGQKDNVQKSLSDASQHKISYYIKRYMGCQSIRYIYNCNTGKVVDIWVIQVSILLDGTMGDVCKHTF